MDETTICERGADSNFSHGYRFDRELTGPVRTSVDYL